MERQPEKLEYRVWTLPNLLSMARIGMIPAFVRLYALQGDGVGAALVLLLSGVTDVADGCIARRFGMTSNFGKMLDPAADKLTQAAVLACLIPAFPWMLVPLGLMVVKEGCAALLAVVVIHRTRQVEGADWHGKVNTALLYAMMGVHLLWDDIPARLSTLLVFVCVGMMSLSFVLYSRRGMLALREHKRQNEEER